ncbi:MAG: alpha/beta fold hydrolase [Pseudoxanthomonas sp.]
MTCCERPRSSRPLPCIALALLGLLACSLAQAASPVRGPWWTGLPPMKSTQVHGQTIRYYDVGQGPTLVLLHGLGSNAGFDWGAVIPELAKHYRVLAPDQLGFGGSAKPQVNYGVQTWADMLAGFLVDRGVTRFQLAGESLGGWIAGWYTANAADAGWPLPERLVLVDAAGHRSLVEGGAKATFPPLSHASVRDGLRGFVFHNPEVVDDAVVEQAFRDRLAAGDQSTQEHFWLNAGDPAALLDDKLARIRVPTLVVWGAEDHLIPLADGQDFAARIAGARLVVIPDAGHAPGIEQPALFLDAVLPFLADRGR